MRKIKKSLAVLLAVIMLATFMPLFASAATTINRNNVKIVPPSVSPAEITYGQTLADVTLTGGECWYVDPDTGAETLVPGHFEVRSTTTMPGVSDAYNLMLKFVSDDTTQYSNISLLTATRTTLKSGTWPAIKVNGLDGTLVEAPTAAAILTGQQLSAATLSGGIVNDADGNAVTGTWSYVYPNDYPAASGKYEVQFTATGYNALKTTVDVTVTSNGNATISEAPAIKYYMGVNDYLVDSVFTGGKVVDDDGNEITTGKWSFADTETQKAAEVVFDKEGTFTYKAQWVALGYPILFADVSITVDAGYTVDKPTLTSPFPYVETKAQIPFVYGNASVPGTYVIEDADATLSTNKNTTQSAKLTFVPENENYKPTSWSYNFKVKANDVWYTPTDDTPTILVPYGFSGTAVYYYFETGKLANALNWPDYFMDQHVFRFTWSSSTYDIKSMNVGDKVLVSGWVWYSDSLGYSSVAEDVYIEIASSTYEGDFGRFHSPLTDKYTGEITYKFACDVPGITGTVTISDGDKVIATYTPDVNGKISETVKYTPGKDGTYVLTATYTPAETDKVTVANPVVTSDEVVVDTLNQYKLTIYVANQKFEYEIYEGETFAASWATFSMETPADVFEYWEVTDVNGNKVTIDTLDTTRHNIQFNMPSQDIIITAKGDIEGMTASDGTLGSSLWSFFEKLKNWFIQIYKLIFETLIPTFETF